MAYAALYPLSNFMLFVANRYGVPVPFAIKTWMVFYPFLIAFLGFGPNLLDYAGAVAGAFMALTSALALIGLRGALGGENRAAG